MLTDEFQFAVASELTNEELSILLGLEVTSQEEPHPLLIKRRTDNVYAVIGANAQPYESTFIINPQNVKSGFINLQHRHYGFDIDEFPFINSSYIRGLQIAEERSNMDLLIPIGAFTPQGLGAHYQNYLPEASDSMLTTISRDKALLVYQFVQECKAEDPSSDFSKKLSELSQ